MLHFPSRIQELNFRTWTWRENTLLYLQTVSDWKTTLPMILSGTHSTRNKQNKFRHCSCSVGWMSCVTRESRWLTSGRDENVWTRGETNHCYSWRWLMRWDYDSHGAFLHQTVVLMSSPLQLRLMGIIVFRSDTKSKTEAVYRTRTNTSPLFN